MSLPAAPSHNPLWKRLVHRFPQPFILLPLIFLAIIYVTYSLSSFDVLKPKYIPIIGTVENQQENGSYSAVVDSPHSDLATLKVDQELFVKEYLTTQLTGSFNGQAMYDICSAQPWDLNKIFECPPLEGGYGNVRQTILQCLRITIAGGGSFIMPLIARRSNTDISDFRTQDFVSMDYLFDISHFKRELGIFCPQLKIYESIKDAPGSANISKKFELSPDLLPGLTPSHRVLADPNQYKPALDKWLKDVNTEQVSPVHISFTNRLIWTWPTTFDPPAFIRSFGTVVRIRSDIRHLAALALFNLKRNYGLPQSFRAIDISSTDPSYVGIHLRAEKDSRDYGFTDYDTQVPYFTRRLSEFPNMPVVYVASGDRNVTAKFMESIAPTRVVTKHDLLSEAELAELTWDQQALVDLLLLERASYFLGVKDSSFSWLLTLRRAAAENWVIGDFPTGPCWATREDGQKIRRGCEKDLAKSEFWRDELSALVGNDLPGTERVEVLRNSIFP